MIVLDVWTFGSPMVIFLAGLRQIPQMYYEAAAIDGAGRVRRFVSITLPLLPPIIFFNLVLQLIGSFQTFTQAFVVSGGSGGPADSTLFYRSTSTNAASATSTWATRPRSRGCCSWSSRCYRRELPGLEVPGVLWRRPTRSDDGPRAGRGSSRTSG
ncbi:carbohydrate ABC transporter permease [Pseudonocardia zijingensis]